MKKLTQLTAPALAGVVKEQSTYAAVAEMRNCLVDGADMIDLHLSCLENTDVDSLRKIMKLSQLPVLALNYNTAYDRKNAGFSEEERVASLLRAVEAGAAGIDMQGYTFHLPSKSGFCGEDRYSFTKGNPKEIVTDESVIRQQCDLIRQVHAMGGEVLLSCHPGIPMTGEQVVELARFLEQRGPDIIKIVTVANTQEELWECVKTMAVLKKELKTPVSYHASGAAGRLSRILNPLLGGQIAFCVDRYNEASTMEQMHLGTVKSVLEGLRILGGVE